MAPAANDAARQRQGSGGRVFASAVAGMTRAATPTMRRQSTGGPGARPGVTAIAAAAEEKVPAAQLVVAEPPAKLRQFVTRWPSAWHEGPSAESTKIRTLHSGIWICELRNDSPAPGWVAVEPHGFVKQDDMVVAQDAPASGPGSPSSPRDRRASAGSGSSTEEAVTSVEPDLQKLRQERAALALEVAQLKETRQSEEDSLERCHQEKLDLTEKLARARDAVANTVGFLDRIYTDEEREVTEDDEDPLIGAVACAEEADAVIKTLSEEYSGRSRTAMSTCSTNDELSNPSSPSPPKVAQ